MNDVMNFLNTVVFTLGGTPVVAAELVGFVLGVACVWLVAKANIWTFPVGIVQAAFFFVLFIEYQLYADAYLQIFFIVVQVFGWWAWLKAGPNRTKLHVKNAPRWVWPLVIGALAVFVYLMIPVLREAHGAYPLADSTTTGLSVMAQCMLSFKWIENWFLWIIADVIYIPLYFYKELYFTSLLYIVFMSLCVMGLFHWRKVQRDRIDGIIGQGFLEARQGFDDDSWSNPKTAA